MRNNPTCHLRKSQLWGFEVSHILVSFSVMMASNLMLSALGLPVFLSWILGLFCLAILRILSVGKKAGHMGFLFSFLVYPRVFLGCALRNGRGGACASR